MIPKLNIHDKEHFKKSVAFARRHPVKECRYSFRMAIGILNGMKRNGYSKCDSLEIWADWVPYSFGWAFMKNQSRVFNGGMLLHGYGETFAVELTSKPYPHWSIHT